MRQQPRTAKRCCRPYANKTVFDPLVLGLQLSRENGNDAYGLGLTARFTCPVSLMTIMSTSCGTHLTYRAVSPHDVSFIEAHNKQKLSPLNDTCRVSNTRTIQLLAFFVRGLISRQNEKGARTKVRRQIERQAAAASPGWHITCVCNCGSRCEGLPQLADLTLAVGSKRVDSQCCIAEIHILINANIICLI